MDFDTFYAQRQAPTGHDGDVLVGITAKSDIPCLVSTGGDLTTRALYTAGLELSLVIF